MLKICVTQTYFRIFAPLTMFNCCKDIYYRRYNQII
nr:MAG TPA: hypothetical protein [Caudoviricetes sp.]